MRLFCGESQKGKHMSLRKWCFGSLMAVFAVLLFGVPLRASADLYQIVDLGSSGHSNLIGLTSTGDVVVRYFFGNTECGGSAICWEVFAKDGGLSFFDTAPSLTYDKGGSSPCNNSVLPIPIDDGAIRFCNNGRAVFTYASFYQLWTAPDPVGGPAPRDQVTLISNAHVGPVFLNSEGDVAFDTGYRNMVAYNLGPTAEPSALVLVATGAIGAADLFRRRLARQRRV